MEQIIKDFEHSVNKARGEYDDYVDLTVEDAAKILELLKKLTTASTTWVCHLYRCGNKRYECSWCHGTSWTPSDYCPDCGTRMAEVVNMDD